MSNRTLYRFFYLSNAMAVFTGIIYGYFKYILKKESLFGKVPHPSTSIFLNIHLLLSIFLVLSIGSLISTHIIPKIKSKNKYRRKTGLSLSLLSLLIIFDDSSQDEIGLNPDWTFSNAISLSSLLS